MSNKKLLLPCFEKRPWVECGGSKHKYSVPKFELDFCPDHWGSPFGLKLHETVSYVIKQDLHRERNIFRTFAPSTTSVIPLYYPIGAYCVTFSYHPSIQPQVLDFLPNGSAPHPWRVQPQTRWGASDKPWFLVYCPKYLVCSLFVFAQRKAILYSLLCVHQQHTCTLKARESMQFARFVPVFNEFALQAA